jgi:NADH-ubiquinone oxidoreductase chain 2
LLSSLLSLIIGTVLGLTQSRIKRLLAYSTISHLGFILLSISVNSIESSQAFIFYLMQYTISNLNAFILILCMGYALFFFFNDSIEYNKLQDKNNSPIQLTNQIKGYHYINPMLALSLAITLFSFVGVPPLIGFFAKQMVLSSALDKGYVFLVLVAILTSVIAAVYYLGIIKRIYFDQHDYTIHSPNNYNFASYSIYEKDSKYIKNILISNYLSITISIITMLILLFILIPQESLNMSNIVTLIIYTPK